ncbi:hypothetical protein [Bradyrhizobium sp. USDA 4486]
MEKEYRTFPKLIALGDFKRRGPLGDQKGSMPIARGLRKLGANDKIAQLDL